MRKLLALCLLALPSLAYSQYGRFDFQLQSAQGQAIAGAQINVYVQPSCGAAYSGPATLYPSASGGTPLTQPLGTDGFGAAHAYAGAGSCYTVVYYSPFVGTRTFVDQVPVTSGSGAGGIGDQIQEFGPFTAQCGTSNGYALMNSSAVATLPAYTEKCLIPFSAVGAGTVAQIVSGSTNIFNECPPAGLVSSVSLASPQTFHVWSNGANWEASCPVGLPVFNVKQMCGASGNGATDDTAAIDSCVAILNAAGKGALYFPAGNYLVSSTLTTITAPAAIYGDGAISTDLTQSVSQVSFSNGTTDGFLDTSKYVSLHDLAIVNTSGTPTAGAGFHYCYGGAYQFPTFVVSNVTFANTYTGFSSCVAENAIVSNSGFYGMLYDGILLGDVAPYNSGDTDIHDNFATGSGSNANAFIDFEGSTNARIHDNKTVVVYGTPPATLKYSVYVGSRIAPGLNIHHNDFEVGTVMPIELGADCSGDNIDGNGLIQLAGSTVGPAIHCGIGQTVSIGMNTFVNVTGSTMPEAILFDSSPYNSTILPQSLDQAYSGGGYTLVQSGMTDAPFASFGNRDLGNLVPPLVASGQVNTYSAYLQDFSAATIKLPVAYGGTTAANGNIVFDDLGFNWHVWLGTNGAAPPHPVNDGLLAAFDPNAATATNCADLNKVSGQWFLETTSGGPCANIALGTVSSSSGTTTTAHSFGTAFAATPNCTASPYSNSGVWYFSTLPSTTSTGVITYASSGAQTFSIQCVGAKGIW